MRPSFSPLVVEVFIRMALESNNVLATVVDPHHNVSKFANWKTGGSKLNISGKDYKIISDFIKDMEVGRNVNGTAKGPRSYSRLNSLRVRIPQIANFFKKQYSKSLTEITRDEATELFHKLSTGEIRRLNGKPYKSWRDHVKDFRSFWRWYMKVQRRLYYDTNGHQGAILGDITEDITDGKRKPPAFVYFTIEELQKMMDCAPMKYKTLTLFLFDSIIRAPTELSNIKVKDITPVPNSDKLYLNIPEEAAKTYGRKIKLMLSQNVIKRYIEINNLKPNDYLFKISPKVVNQYLKKLGKKTIGKEPTMYDFRHSGICYWMPRYKHETALRYRAGHKDSRMLDYYSQFLGMKDTIQEEDLDDTETRTHMQKEIETLKNQNELMQEQFQKQQEQIKKLQQEYKEDVVKEVLKTISHGKEV